MRINIVICLYFCAELFILLLILLLLLLLLLLLYQVQTIIITLQAS